MLAARGDSREAMQALRELCDVYYAPVDAFIRRAWAGPDDSRDVTHEFFAKLLAGQALKNVERGRGRFRSYLLGAVKHFLCDRRDCERAVKRGAGAAPRSLDEPGDLAKGEPSIGNQLADPAGFPPDAFFDRHWALTVLSRTIETLRVEADAQGEGDRFEALKPWLSGDAATLVPADAAQTLGVSDGAAKVAIHRFRKRFRQLVKAEIGATVADAAEVSSELGYLIEALSFGEQQADRHAPQ